MAKNEQNTQKRGGWSGMLGPTTLEREDAPTTGKPFEMRDGSILDEAPFYRIEGQNRNYVGAAGVAGDAVVFQGGVGRTDNRELAWMLHREFGYKVIAEHPEVREPARAAAKVG